MTSKQQPKLPTASPALKAVAYFFMALLVFSLFRTREFKYIDNTEDGMEMFFRYAVVGLICSIPVYLLVYQFVPELKHRKKISKQMQMGLGAIAFSLFLIFPTTASYLNRKILVGKSVCGRFNILYKSTSPRVPHERFVFIDLGNGEERLILTENEWIKLRERDTIELCIQKGRLGYNVIYLVNHTSL